MKKSKHCASSMARPSSSRRATCGDWCSQRKAALAHSARLETIERMRVELAALWARSAASTDQLLAQLRDWLERAEKSGIAQLQEFSHRLRCYAA